MQNQPARGIAYLCAGVLVFSVQDVIIKKFSGSYPLTEVVFIRSVVGIPILLVVLLRQESWRALLPARVLPLVTRALVLFGAYTAYYMAFPALPLADAVALYFTVPLFLTALAGPFLGEHVGWKVWLAVLLGFAGVLVMLQPGKGLFEPAALLSLLSAALYGISMLMARKMANQQSATVMAFYQNAVFLIGSGIVAMLALQMPMQEVLHPSLRFLLRTWLWPSPNHLFWLAFCGVAAAAGTLFLTNAYRVAKTSIVTPFEYTGMLWAPMWGWLVFAEIPKISTFAGAAIIAVAGLLVIRLSKR